jgi:hypothetical protein
LKQSKGALSTSESNLIRVGRMPDLLKVTAAYLWGDISGANLATFPKANQSCPIAF